MSVKAWVKPIVWTILWSRHQAHQWVNWKTILIMQVLCAIPQNFTQETEQSGEPHFMWRALLHVCTVIEAFSIIFSKSLWQKSWILFGSERGPNSDYRVCGLLSLHLWTGEKAGKPKPEQDVHVLRTRNTCNSTNLLPATEPIGEPVAWLWGGNTNYSVSRTNPYYSDEAGYPQKDCCNRSAARSLHILEILTGYASFYLTAQNQPYTDTYLKQYLIGERLCSYGHYLRGIDLLTISTSAWQHVPTFKITTWYFRFCFKRQ